MTTTYRKDRFGVIVGERYVWAASCGGSFPRHSGNTRYAATPTNGCYQCQGCGDFATASSLIEAQEHEIALHGGPALAR